VNAITVKDALTEATLRLSKAGCDTPSLDAELLLAHSLTKDRAWLYAYPQKSVDPDQLRTFLDLIRRREQREPVAYLIGHKEFFCLEFEVNRHVLIPRPETELLVETALQIFDCNSKIDIVDVGTGSGCIAIALAKHLPRAKLLAIDVSNQALHLAQQNARRHHLADRITFLSGDVLEPLAGSVDLIVSNPPYVSQLELAAGSTSPEVSRYEPRLALDGGDDGLDTIRQLLSQAKEKLNAGGVLLIEIGSTQGQAVRQLAKDYFPQAGIEIEMDLAGLDRLLVVKA
jgi:release factor glutamine methyltransferase